MTAGQEGLCIFGYIKPFKPEMKMKEFDTFQAIYCGLCKQLAHVYGPFSSLTLSYDFTFIAAISIGLSEQCAGFQRCTCTVNPLKKKYCVQSCDDLTFCASTAMLLIYYKIKDDIADSHFWGKLRGWILLPFASHARKKARKQYSVMDDAIAAAMRKQAEIEDAECVSIDRAADPTASALAIICEGLSDDEKQKRILNRFGYLLGRYVYFADALDDLEEDGKKHSYNPFLQKFADKGNSLEEIKRYAHEVLNMTVGEIAPAYELLELKRHKSILDNIIYLGLHNEINRILSGETGKAKKKQKKELFDEKPL